MIKGELHVVLCNISSEGMMILNTASFCIDY